MEMGSIDTPSRRGGVRTPSRARSVLPEAGGQARDNRESELLLIQALWSGDLTRVDEAIRAGANLNSPSAARGKKGHSVVSAFLSECRQKNFPEHIPDDFFAGLIERGLKIASLPGEKRDDFLFLAGRINRLIPGLLNAIDREDTSPENIKAARQSLLLSWARYGEVWKSGAEELISCWDAEDINASDGDGRTALILLADRNCLEYPFLRIFMSCGADAYVTDNKGRTAFSILLEKGTFDDMWSGFLELLQQEDRAGISPVKRALPCLAEDTNTTVLAEALTQGGLDHSQESALALLLSALLLPERNEPLFDMAGSNLISVIKKIGETVEKGVRRGQSLQDCVAGRFLDIIRDLSEYQVSIGENWYPNKYSKKVSAGLVQILLQGIESSTDSALFFLRNYVGETLGEWVKDGIGGAEELISRITSSKMPVEQNITQAQWDI